jgi:hypothetical protein
MRGSVQAVCLVALVAAAGCAGDGQVTGPTDDQQTGAATLRVVHTLAAVPAIDVIVGGVPVLQGLGAGQASDFLPVASGVQLVAFRPTGSNALPAGAPIVFAANDTITVVTIDSASVINPEVLTDSGSVVPPDKSKLRVAHFAAQAPPIDAWRSQPDYRSLTNIMFPFPYRAVSPYLQSDAGVWTVLVTAERRNASGIPVLGDSLEASEPISIPAGQSRTVVIVDRPAGGLILTVIDP